MIRAYKGIFLIPVFLFSFFACEKGHKVTTDDSKAQETSKIFVNAKPFEIADYLEDGRINFKKLTKEGLPSFKNKITEIESFDTDSLKTLNDKKAFWINTYNLFVMDILVKNYPLKSDMFKIEGFFDKYYLNVGGNELTLNDISSEILRFGSDSKDPRINFAISNGTNSSPKLYSKTYSAKQLDEELDKATRAFLQDKNNVLIDKELSLVEDKNKYVLKVSKIFDWFENDFKETGGTVKFLAKNVNKEDADFIVKNEDKIYVDYLPYDYDFAGFKK